MVKLQKQLDHRDFFLIIGVAEINFHRPADGADGIFKFLKFSGTGFGIHTGAVIALCLQRSSPAARFRVRSTFYKSWKQFAGKTAIDGEIGAEYDFCRGAVRQIFIAIRPDRFNVFVGIAHGFPVSRLDFCDIRLFPEKPMVNIPCIKALLTMNFSFYYRRSLSAVNPFSGKKRKAIDFYPIFR